MAPSRRTPSYTRSQRLSGNSLTGSSAPASITLVCSLVKAGRESEIPDVMKKAHDLHQAKVADAKKHKRRAPKAIGPSDTATVVDGLLGVAQCATPPDEAEAFRNHVARIVDEAARVLGMPRAVREAVSMLDELVHNWRTASDV